MGHDVCLIKALHGSLLHIKENGPRNSRSGVCGNIKWGLDSSFMELCAGFPFLSRDDVFPVPASKTDLSGPSAFLAYFSSEDKWNKQTEYGQLRWELVDYVIKRCEDILEKGA